jgi:hypothetical protein
MNKILIICLAMLLSPGYAEESKGAVVISSESWITTGNDSTIHIVDGRLTEKKTKHH